MMSLKRILKYIKKIKKKEKYLNKEFLKYFSKHSIPYLLLTLSYVLQFDQTISCPRSLYRSVVLSNDERTHSNFFLSVLNSRCHTYRNETKTIVILTIEGVHNYSYNTYKKETKTFVIFTK